MNKVAEFSSLFGNMFIAFNELGITGSALTQTTSLDQFCEKTKNFTGAGCEKISSLPQRLLKALTLWGKKHDDSGLIFDFGSSTSFQQNVWNACLAIPFGSTLSYGELAALVKNPKAARAVGSALGVNPFLILIPCHRVIGSGGNLGGYAGGINLKSFLLEVEEAK